MLRMKRERLSRTSWRALLLKQLGEKGVIKDQKKKKKNPKPRETELEKSDGIRFENTMDELSQQKPDSIWLRR